jgi:hypothetical protein
MKIYVAEVGFKSSDVVYVGTDKDVAIKILTQHLKEVRSRFMLVVKCGKMEI